MLRSLWIRILKASGGLVLFAFGVYLTIQASIGVSPWDALTLGIAGRTGLSYGNVSVAIALAVLAADALLGEPIGLGTVLDAVLVGKSVDLFTWLAPVPEAAGFWPGLGLLCLGLLLMGTGQWVYMSAGLCCGPRDSLLVALGRRLPRLPIGLVANVLQALVCAAGWLLGGPVGLGTLLSVFGVGAAMQLVFALVRFEPRRVRHLSLKDLWPAPGRRSRPAGTR